MRVSWSLLTLLVLHPSSLPAQDIDALTAGSTSKSWTAAEEAPASTEPAGLVPIHEPIVNGQMEWGFPSVAYLVLESSEGFGFCSATLIGCSTVLTAAHCFCEDASGELLSGAACQNRSDLLDPTKVLVFLPHAGFFGVSSVKVHPSFEFEERSDLAILKLNRAVTGVRASAINTQMRVPSGTTGAIVGFGKDDRVEGPTGIKRSGVVQTRACTQVPASTHVCWDYANPVGSPGTDSNTCEGDSGGPLFVDFQGNVVLAGVTSGGSNPSCRPPDHSYDADVYVDRSWIQSVAGSDLGARVCGGLPAIGETGTILLGDVGAVSAASPEHHATFEVPAGTTRLRMTLNAEEPPASDIDLFLRRGAKPSPQAFDCASQDVWSLEACEIANPQPGTWHLLARRFAGAAPFQVTGSVFGAASGGPTPPGGAWLRSAGLPGFEAKVLLNGTTLGSREPDCIIESLCVSGALAGRPEIFIKVIGPRPNGYLWTQISRFTPSKVEVWLRRISTGQINHYVLAAVPGTSDDVSGLQDKEAYVP